MISFLMDVNWQMLDQSCSVDVYWDVLSMKLNECIEKFVPLRRVVLFSKPKCLKHIRKLLLLKKKWFHKNRVKYNKIAKEYELAVKSFYDYRESYVINSNDLSKLYSYVNMKLCHTLSIPPLMKSDGSLATMDYDKCNVFNDYFSSVFTTDNGVLPIFHPAVSSIQVSQQVEFTYDNVICALNRLPSKYSRTPDGFPAGFLKSVAPGIAIPLSRLFRLSMDCGDIPLSWKKAMVCPIFKKGSRKLPSNYRPVSLTSVCCKVMESIVCESMVTFLRSNSLISKDQFGFLARRSTCTQLLMTLNEWTLHTDFGDKVDSVYIDFAKAFDSISHTKLLHKVECYGFSSSLVKWLSSFLTNRSQQVYIGQSLSSSLPVSSGVPQGSVLGPLLFLIYINDLPECLEPPVQAKIFADDTKLYATHSSNSSSPLTLSLLIFSVWSQTWQLNIAFQKCSVISFGHNSASHSYSLGGVLLNRVFDIRDLGVHITSDFKPSLHCAYIAAKAFQRCSLLLKALRTLNISALCRVFHSYVRPILEYNAPVWNPWLVKDIKTLERVQRYFTRSLFKRIKIPMTSYADRLSMLGFHSLEYRRVFLDLVMCFKIVKKLVDLDASDFFHINLSPYTTRGNSIKLSPLTTPHHNYRANFFSVRIIPIWNSLPDTVVKSSSERTFRLMLNNVDLSIFCKCYAF